MTVGQQIAAWAVAIGGFWLLTSWVVGLGQVVNSGMEPTLRAGDQYLAWLYRSGRPVRRGDVVTYRPEGSLRVGRVIAVAGDQVQVDQGRVTLNGEPLHRVRAGTLKAGWGDDCGGEDLRTMWEFLPGVGDDPAVRYQVVDHETAEDALSLDPTEVPEGSLLILPDRRHTLKEDLSTVPADTLSGRVVRTLHRHDECSGQTWFDRFWADPGPRVHEAIDDD